MLTNFIGKLSFETEEYLVQIKENSEVKIEISNPDTY